MERLFGILLVSLALLTTALVSIIIPLSNSLPILSVICIGAVFIIGLILWTTKPDCEIEKNVPDEDIEEELVKLLGK